MSFYPHSPPNHSSSHPHKNAHQLLDEIEELARELSRYEGLKRSFLRSFEAIVDEYRGKHLRYAEYERKMASLLKGKTKAEWIEYYHAYEYSLAKRIDFIASQLFTVVYADESIARLSSHNASSPSEEQSSFHEKSAEAAQQAQQAQQRDVFGIDAEILRLKRLLASSVPKQAQVARQVAHDLSLQLPEFREIEQEILAAEAQVKQQVGQVGQVGHKSSVHSEHSVSSAGRAPSSSDIQSTQAQVEGPASASKSVSASSSPLKTFRFWPLRIFKSLSFSASHHSSSSPPPPPQASSPTSVSVGSKIRAAVSHLLPKKRKAKPSSPSPVQEVAFGSKHPRKALRGFLHLLSRRLSPSLSSQAPQREKRSLPDDLISFTDVVDTAKEENLSSQKASVKAGLALQQEQKSFFAFLKNLKDAFSPKQRQIFVEDIISLEKSARKIKEERHSSSGDASAGIAFGWFSPKRLLAEFTSRFSKKQEPIISERTSVPLHMKKLREMRKKLYRDERLSGFDTTLLAQEAKRIKRILEVEKREVYQGSSLGLIANVTVRKLSLFLVNNFPQFFGYLYNALRAANVKVLSNTYVNIMVLITLIVGIATFFLVLLISFIFNYPLYQIVLRSFLFSLLSCVMCATIFYTYPFMKIRDRRRKTTTNLPFAINHMSAVATSGVPPARMFELIAASDEYEEVSIELKKVVDFINIFGYDLLTAVRAVASTTPSLPFKKFLEGMVSTIETGGDLVAYLRQEADEAALDYKLERQRYNETVNTYSDIYTGVLIAAPLFFVAAMALVNILGGSLGGLSVGVVMALGAYLGIPVLNLIFLLFLQLTQPEV